MDEDLSILLVENIGNDADLAEREVKFALKSCMFHRVETHKDYVAALKEFRPDLIISSLDVPGIDGLMALKLCLAEMPLTPFIFLTGATNVDTAVECMKAGATDYVTKENIKLLGPAVISALEEKRRREERFRAEEELKEKARFLQTIIDTIPNPVFYKDIHGIYRGCNLAFAKYMGVSPDEIVGKSVFEFIPRERAERHHQKDVELFRQPGIQEYEFEIVDKYGSTHEIVFHKATFANPNGSSGGLVGVMHDITERIRVDKELKQQKELLQTILDNIPIIIAYMDMNGNFLWVNKWLCQSLGWQLEEMQSRDIFTELYPDPDYRQSVMDFIKKAEGKWGEFTLRTRYGAVLETAWTSVNLSDGAHIGIGQDITERRRAEEKLKLNEARLTSLVRILQYKAETIQELLDYTLDEAIKLTGSRIGYIYHYNQDQREFILNSWSKQVMKECTIDEPPTVYQLEKTGIWGEVVRQRQPIMVNDFQAPNPLKKGYPEGHARLEKYLTVPIFKEDDIVGVVGVANKESDYDQTDILQLTLLMDSAWKNIERKTAEAHSRRLSSMVDQAAESVVITDLEGIIQYVNPAFEKITGYSMNDTVGKTPRILRSGQHTPEFYENLWKTIKRGEVWTGRFINRRKDGALFHERATISPVRNESGRIINFVALKDDITKEVELEAQFLQAQKMEAVGRLAGGVAHDFNNMLSVVLGYAELIMLQLDEQDPLREDIGAIISAAERSAEMTKHLLAFARKQTVLPVPVDLNENMAKSKKMLRRLIGEDIDLQFLPGDDLWTIKIDPSQLDQIVANLAVNSRDAISGVGTITIQTDNVILDDNFCHTHLGANQGEYAMFSFSDTGTGMDQKVLERLFEPFFTTKEQGKGTGLGLSTVYGVVKQNNGYIEVQSEMGFGTIFKIYFPKFQGTPELMEKESRETALIGTETILIVEDEEKILDLYKKILSQHGYHVLSAGTPGDAILLCEKYPEKLHLLITDVVMPLMNGRELHERIEAIQPEIQTIYMSGYPKDVVARHGVIIDGIRFIQKPFSMKALLTKVREVLDNRK